MEIWNHEAAAKSLAENIRQRIKYKYPLTTNLRESLENLGAQLEKLPLPMRDLNPHEVQYTTSLLKGIFEEAEDAVDSTFLLKGIFEEAEDAVDAVRPSHFRSKFSLFRSCFLPKSRSCILPKSRDHMSETEEKIEQICLKVNELETEKKIEQICLKVHEFNSRYGRTDIEFPVEERPQETAKLHRAECSSRATQVEEDRVIGFGDEAETLVALLIGGPENLEVISVVGVYGQGKTTLANMVYNDPKVSNEYKIRAFVYVTSGYDKKKELVNILNSFIQTDDILIGRMSEEELRLQVYLQLEGKQYLVVLDNIRSSGDWYKLRAAFPINKENRCRVLFTTRSTEVAELPRGIHSHSLYRLKFLNEEDSRELFRWRVFGENDCPVELLEYEVKIVNKCRGVPLAIVVAAAMVARHQKRVDGWNDVASSMEHYDAGDFNALLYKQLPRHLKPFFLHLAIFPRDYEIPVWKLLRLWIAKGLIHSTYDDLEDVAEGYLDELVDHSLVMVSKKRSNGRNGTCRRNGAIYEYCKEESSREMPVLYTERRHFCIDGSFSWYSLDLIPIESTGARSLMFFWSAAENVELMEHVSSYIPNHFKYLKVLEVESLSFSCFPNNFCTLVLLKYLAISGWIESLPETLSDLWNLQTLIVKTACDALEIKADVWKMPNFRHLHTNVAASFPFLTTKCQKSRDGENNVRTLCWISSASCKKQVFDQTSKLKKLGVRGRLTELFGGEASLFSFLHKLENLKLWNDENPMNRLSGFPPKGAFPKQLTKLILSHTRLKWKEMRTVGEMESLEILKLKEYAFVGEQWKTENGGFLRLRHLHIGHTDLMVWEAAADHFPVLGSLEINGCYGLRRVPHSLADILSLQSVRLHSITSPGVTYSLKRIRLVKFLQTKQANRRKTFEISYFPQQV